MTPVASIGSDFKVSVLTTHHRGHTPEEIADRCLARILSVSETAPPPIRQQAESFRESLRAVLVLYLKEAAASERVTLEAKLREAGLSDAADILRRL